MLRMNRMRGARGPNEVGNKRKGALKLYCTTLSSSCVFPNLKLSLVQVSVLLVFVVPD